MSLKAAMMHSGSLRLRWRFRKKTNCGGLGESALSNRGSASGMTCTTGDDGFSASLSREALVKPRAWEGQRPRWLKKQMKQVSNRATRTLPLPCENIRATRTLPLPGFASVSRINRLKVLRYDIIMA